ncbi:aminotransferase class I/II-fold pyridoxal phosphate-dependent enzyme [Flavobacterium sp. LC2016-12]|uniref:aminotransferase class I/II-fold pyridoxal phosphate-dependent enzyme n=1 Tax=Flavobacterium sp. LC2016-12 TaxID=2783794 RepID=UPI00188CC4D9|nr:aminotransferase class I/II-fold pyridoxal phosphate-dependent enzyme [Flavobacterium sp. LC2016-12]MBF4465684.1 aminotransferase class I/II-fold pyridoxal phosphate-dependent enzyme [Flavobacterium sp. LC2016-12]
MEIKDLIINQKCDLRKALKVLDTVGQGILFVTENNEKLVGVITDGDIRRSLLLDVNLDVEISEIMNKNFLSLSIDTDNTEILHHINNKIKVIPLVDEEGRVVDYASINRLRRISICSPLLEGNELLYLTECIKTNWISSQGKYVRSFESLFKNYHENFDALAVSNGTVAIHLALDALGIGEGDEVIVPNLTFAASINAIIYTGATPVLVDVEKDSFNIDFDKVERFITNKTKAIMPVHLYGQSCDMGKLALLVEKYNLLVVEDCAEALGSKYDGRPVGVFGDAATFSFFGNKTITTGEGGMVLFKDPIVAEKAAVLRDHGMSKEKRYWHDFVGYNYRLTNLQAAIGVAQFERLDEFVNAKRNLAKIYNETLNKFPFFQTPIQKENTFNSYWLYTFLIGENAPFKREDLMSFLNNKGIETRPVFYPLHIMPPYIAYGEKENLEVSSKISESGMSLPSSVNLSEAEINYICSCISDFIGGING